MNIGFDVGMTKLSRVGSAGHLTHTGVAVTAIDKDNFLGCSGFISVFLAKRSHGISDVLMYRVTAWATGLKCLKTWPDECFMPMTGNFQLI